MADVKEDCKRFIDTTSVQLAKTSAVRAADETQLREIFKVLVGDMDKGPMRTAIIKKIDEYFIYFQITLCENLQRVGLSSSQQVPLSVKSMQLLCCDESNMYSILAKHPSLTLEEIYGWLLCNNTACLSELMHLLFNKLDEESIKTATLLKIANILQLRLSKNLSAWKEDFPASLACLIALLFQLEGVTVSPVARACYRGSVVIQSGVLGFSACWREKLQCDGIISSAALVTSLSPLLPLSITPSALDEHAGAIVASLLVYSRWLRADKHHAAALTDCFRCIFTSLRLCHEQGLTTVLTDQYALDLVSVAPPAWSSMASEKQCAAWLDKALVDVASPIVAMGTFIVKEIPASASLDEEGAAMEEAGETFEVSYTIDSQQASSGILSALEQEEHGAVDEPVDEPVEEAEEKEEVPIAPKKKAKRSAPADEAGEGRRSTRRSSRKDD